MSGLKEKYLNKKNLFYIVVFCILTVICYFFPYTHDDWAWGSKIGVERLTSLFKNYNGRWAGNLLVMAMTRCRVLRAFVISGALSSIVILMKKIVNYKNKHSIYISIILLLLIPVGILAQAIAWTSGFANYVPPIVILFIFIYFNKSINNVDIDNKYIIPFFIIGFLCALFSEHLTVYSILLSIAVVLYNKIKSKKYVWSNISYMIGTILGSFLMFKNITQGGYRTIESGNIFLKVIKTYTSEFYEYFVHSNHILNIFIGIVCLIFIYKIFNDYKKEKTKKIVLKIIVFIIILTLGYETYVTIAGNSSPLIYDNYIKYFESFLYAFYCLSILSLVSIYVKNTERKARFIFELCSIVIIAGPLLIVEPIGYRCFMPTYAFFVLFAVDLFDYVIESKKGMDITKWLKCLILTCLAFFMVIYGYAFKIETERVNYIKHNLTQTKFVLPKIPYTRYMQVPNPGNPVFITRFKLYYGIDEKAELEFVAYKQWKKNINKK